MSSRSVQSERMPIRLPDGNLIRQRIAEIAASNSGGSIDHYLSLLGRIEPIPADTEVDGAAWRLTAYHGSYAETAAIERAVQSVQRTYPFLRACTPPLVFGM